MVDRIVERSDGTTSERITETPSAPGPRPSSNGAAAAARALYLINQNNRENVKTEAVTEAAKSVGDAAKYVGGAA